MSEVYVGMIGCGGIAYGKHFPSLAKIPEVRLKAFFDVSAERAHDAKEKFGAPDATVYSSIDDLLNDTRIQVVHVCTPNDTHAEISIKAMEAGKHVLCEKPMAKTSEDARRMLETSERTGRKLSIAYQNRFRADSRWLKEACSKGELGDIYLAKAHAVRRRGVPTWGVFLDKEKQGGGPLIDIGTHALDLALWMMDNYEPKVVLGMTYQKLAEQGSPANAWGNWDPAKFTVEDSAFAMITMKNGATIWLESSWALNTLDYDEAKVTLSGTKAGADMKNGLRVNGEEHGHLYTKEIVLGNQWDAAAPNDSAEREARAWIDSILSDKEPVVTAKQALVVQEILEAIYESSSKGQAISFG
ncbi:Gfo/Idh/MocA family protein [Cohnella fermenti]|uniref:Gfo/Idh/MocA family oxidoreductase n=1 Tax=Cohnella fermenti TaxID=2565925 RepID=A0A4S4BL32_9BACL|nr:Gfo/Idh/MocA family oxidoreductase [Cohnella fermenti]THF75456.1 Gfo/Idh/MocA family oxidoreductase [Cohnella fermenti]